MEVHTPYQTRGFIDRHGPCPECLQKREVADVLIIGAGAAGVAVALSVLNKSEEGWPIDSLVMVEESDEPGLGLAYSTLAADGTISNRRDDAMSLIPGKPNHFRDWRKKDKSDGGKEGDYCQREVYGDYLRDMLRKVNKKAWELMVDFRFVRHEAIDLDRYEYEHIALYRVALRNGCSMYAKKVVLALGNFLSNKEAHLKDVPTYFSNPWPMNKFEAIPKGAAVGVVGTNSSAIDVVAKLNERNHEGPICMMSRDGRFPRVESPSRHFKRTYAIHSLVRGLEKGEISLEELLDLLEETILHYDGTKVDTPVADTPEIGSASDIHRNLAEDMKNSVTDGVKAQHVLNALKPVAERIWKYATSHEKASVLEKHPAWKAINQETMSYFHAMTLLYLTTRENFQIIQDERVGYKGDYFLMGKNNRVRVDYVIEATGLEHDASVVSLESSILKRMIRKDLVEPDRLGGIKVIFASSKAGPDLYAIGSLTKGTHHFVENIDRIVSHASRISDSLVGLPPSQPKHVALFVGRDLFSTVIMMNIVPKLLAKGHMPFVFLLEPPDSSIYLPEDERQYYYFESVLVTHVIIPHYKSNGGPPRLALMTDSIENEYGILVQQVKDMNDRTFLSNLQQCHIDIGFLIGSNVEAEEGIKKACVLCRLKPGSYPYYQNIQQVVENRGNKFGYSLEYLDPEKEHGRLLSSKDRSIAKAPCACSAMLDSHKLGVELVLEATDKFSRDTLLSKVPRNFSISSNRKNDNDQPLKLVDVSSILSRIATHFTTDETSQSLLAVIQEELVYWAGTPIDMERSPLSEKRNLNYVWESE
ncbi:FAD-NAD(P)-binding-domain-containing protein [Hypoxylon crocopeplum]|nr:FAD-NAD(P)-binding-domain-containing protein [Hypoxylon crocopeplum]